VTPRRLAFDVLRQVTGEGAYANLALAKRLATAGLNSRDSGLVTELVAGTCRLMGTYDRIIEAAAGRQLSSLQPAVVDILRLGAHQLLTMGVKRHAAVGATVDLARDTVGQRVTGVVNAILRKVAARTMNEWTDQLATGEDAIGALAVRGHHPRWIVEAYADPAATVDTLRELVDEGDGRTHTEHFMLSAVESALEALRAGALAPDAEAVCAEFAQLAVARVR